MDLTVFSEDCFHFSERGHAEMAIALWNNMVSGQGGNLRLFGSVLREDKQVYLRVCVRALTHMQVHRLEHWLPCSIILCLSLSLTVLWGYGHK